MSGITLPNCYRDHEPPAGYFDPPDPYNTHIMNFGYNMRGIIEYAKEKGIDSSALTWEELQMFRFEISD